MVALNWVPIMSGGVSLSDSWYTFFPVWLIIFHWEKVCPNNTVFKLVIAILLNWHIITSILGRIIRAIFVNISCENVYIY